jgi:DNA-binding phage protein
MGNTTNKILNDLNNGKSLSDIFEENKSAYSSMLIGDYIDVEIKKRKMTKAKVIKDSGVNKRFFYDIIKNKKTPSRRYIIRIFLALKIDLKDVQWYLKATNYPQLYARDKRDCVIIYCITNKLPVPECNEMLNKIGLENLGFEYF